MRRRTAPRERPAARSASTWSRRRPASDSRTVKDTRCTGARYHAISASEVPMPYEQIHYEPGRVATLTFARPQALNAITRELMTEATDAVGHAAVDAGV